MGRILNNVNHGPGLLKRLGRIVAASVAAVATLAGGMLVAGTANAATAQGPGYWFNPFNSGLVHAGHHGFALGVQGTPTGVPRIASRSAWPVSTRTRALGRMRPTPRRRSPRTWSTRTRAT